MVSFLRHDARSWLSMELPSHRLSKYQMSQSNHSYSGSQSPSKRKPIRKFYVRSGKVSWLVVATDCDIAVLRFIQKALQGSLIHGRKPINKKLRLLDQGAMKLLAKARLDSRILVSEAGFSRSEAGTYATAVVINRWRNQIAALEKLIRPAD